MTTTLGIGRTLQGCNLATAQQRITAALSTQGFGVLTEVNVQETLKKKLDVTIRPYKILGACNPNFAHQALQLHPLAGLMMPCNVVLYEEGGNTVVTAVDPTQLPVAALSKEIATLAAGVRDALAKVVEAA